MCGDNKVERTAEAYARTSTVLTSDQRSTPMAEAILTLSQALNRAMSGQVIAPDSKRQAQVRASMGMAVNVLARQAALKAAKR
jgi:hypothetical protein